MRYEIMYFAEQCLRRAAWEAHFSDFPPKKTWVPLQPDDQHSDGDLIARAVCEAIEKHDPYAVSDWIHKVHSFYFRKKINLARMYDRKDLELCAQNLAREFLASRDLAGKGKAVMIKRATELFRDYLRVSIFVQMLGHIEVLSFQLPNEVVVFYFVSIGDNEERLAGLRMILSRLETTGDMFQIGGVIDFNADGIRVFPVDRSITMDAYASRAFAHLQDSIFKIENGEVDNIPATPSRMNCKFCGLEARATCKEELVIRKPNNTGLDDEFNFLSKEGGRHDRS